MKSTMNVTKGEFVITKPDDTMKSFNCGNQIMDDIVVYGCISEPKVVNINGTESGDFRYDEDSMRLDIENVSLDLCLLNPGQSFVVTW